MGPRRRIRVVNGISVDTFLVNNYRLERRSKQINEVLEFRGVTIGYNCNIDCDLGIVAKKLTSFAIRVSSGNLRLLLTPRRLFNVYMWHVIR
jgi:hypothetical protein